MGAAVERIFAWDSEALLADVESAYRAASLSSEWHKEQEAIAEALRQIARVLPASRYRPISVLGIGGSSLVLRVADALFPTVDNALKFPRPISGLAVAVSEMLAKELRFLAEIRYTGIVRMLYYRVIPDVQPFGSLPFYLMEVVEGASSKSYMREQANESGLLNTMMSVAKTLEYLHTFSDAPYVHLDIKPQNIVIASDGQPVLLDLGTCKKIGRDQEQTVLALTRDYAHPGLTRLLVTQETNARSAIGLINRQLIDPSWDLWSFGRTILDWMGVRYEDGSLEPGALAEKLNAYTRKYLFLLCARLLSDYQAHWLLEKVGVDELFIKSLAIKTPSQLIAQIGKLDGSYDPIREVDELATASTGSIQAAPGIHVKNTARLTRTLEHRLFRRLSGVTQLGIVSQVFPGAKHSRREHSLGTYGNVCRMLKALYADPLSPLFRQILEEQDIREILLASLLHDLGQFPMAHDLEDVDDKVFDHEELTQAMLRGVWRTGKRGSKTIRFESLSPIFDAWQTGAERVIGILNAKAKSNAATQKDKLLRSIISGPLDADKLDYLFRDARYTDVPYPSGIDVDRLFRCLTTVVVPKIPGGAQNVPAIGVHAKGRIAAEFMTMSRYAMFSQVYWHHAVRAQKAMLSRAVAALIAPMSAIKTEEFRAQFLDMVCALPESMYRKPVGQAELALEEGAKPAEAVEANFGVGTDLVATDAAVLTWLRDHLISAHLPEAELLQGLLTRKLFKRLWVVGHSTVSERDWNELCDLWERLTTKQKNRAAHSFERKITARLVGENRAQNVTTMPASEAKSLAARLTDSRTPWLLVDMPGAKSGSDVGLHYVSEVQARRMRKDDRAIGTLEASSAWKQYAGDLRTVAGNVRVFCDERLIETVDASISQEVGFEDLLSVVQSESTTSD